MDHVGAYRTVALRDERAATVGPIEVERVDELLHVFTQVVADGEGYPQTPPLTRAVFEATWVTPVTVTVAAVVDGRLAGAYYLKPNQPGVGAHIANAGYVVARAERGAGIGRVLVEDSILRAPLAGFDAVQFNFVFESNPARAMYERLGWREVGRIPDAVPAAGGGREPALVYWRSVARAELADPQLADPQPADPQPAHQEPPDPELAHPEPPDPQPAGEQTPGEEVVVEEIVVDDGVVVARSVAALRPEDPGPAPTNGSGPAPAVTGTEAAAGDARPAAPGADGGADRSPPLDLVAEALGELATVDAARLRAELAEVEAQAGGDGIRRLIESLVRGRLSP